MKKCNICGNTDMKTDNYCELCTYLIGACYSQYSVAQLMALYSHIIGIKVVEDIQNATIDGLKDRYQAEKLKKEGKLN